MERGREICRLGLQKQVSDSSSGEFSDIAQLNRGCAINNDQEHVCADGDSPLAGISLLQADRSCGIDVEGYIRCAGEDLQGMVSGAPTDSGYVQVVMGLYVACALDREGYATCWGGRNWAPDIPFVMLDSQHYSTCGLTADGDIRCWDESFNTVSLFEGDFVYFSSWDGIVCGVEEDGTAECNSTDIAPTVCLTLEDNDNDGMIACDGDCNDNDPLTFLGADDSFGDGIDQDCDGADGTDADGDGFTDVQLGGSDCDDSDPTRNTDTDADGVCDVDDPDDDDDGVFDPYDDFPFDGSESVDSDGDGVGDNSDDFPFDPTETTDTDEDGIGNNADDDDDNDGLADDDDPLPLDAAEVFDNDNDGIGDNADDDDDNDGTLDDDDDFPFDSAETTDSDGDGVGDNADAFPVDICAAFDTDGDGRPDVVSCGETALVVDNDDDGDGVSDEHDPFPLDGTEYVDSDGDGVGDNSDDFPFDPTETTDSDGDGLGDNVDCYDDLLDLLLNCTDSDNDGYPAEQNDCDDNDPNSTIVDDDADCDGVVTPEDCDDTDPQLGLISEDEDCNGVLDIDEVVEMIVIYSGSPKAFWHDTDPSYSDRLDDEKLTTYGISLNGEYAYSTDGTVKEIVISNTIGFYSASLTYFYESVSSSVEQPIVLPADGTEIDLPPFAFTAVGLELISISSE